ncbi:MAG: B12-binding domain-containing radical SAM protein [Planctomycetota bacterium]
MAFIQPPRKSCPLERALPLGLLSLASFIKERGYQPVFIDLCLFSIIRGNSSDYFRQMAQKILSYSPHVLGFGVMCSNMATALLIAEECKKLAPKIPIIFGGPEVCFEEVEVLKTFKQVDIIVRGEGEITLVEVLKALENKKSLSDILGITYRENSQIIRNPDRPLIEDLDQLPFLDFSLLPHLGMYEGKIEAGRGCPFSCAFCATARVCRNKFRMKSPQRLAQELRKVHDIFKRSYIGINHDNFLTSRKIADEFLSLIADGGIVWGCNSRLEALDEGLIKKLKQAGCRQIYLGIETGSSEMQKKIKKNLPLSRLPRVLEMLLQNKIDVSPSFIIGFPNEAESQINQTLLVALNSKCFFPAITVRIFLFTFLKGSELYARAKGKYEYQESVISPLTTGLSAELALIKKYPHIFPSFYYIGNKGIESKVLQKISFLFIFLIRTYARPILSLLEYLSVTPFQLGKKMISYFDAEVVDWDPAQGFHFPQYVSPFRKFIQEYATPLYNEFFWWDEAFKQWEKKSCSSPKLKSR